MSVIDILEEEKEAELTYDFSFMQNTSCQYFPCHQGIALRDFNCLFCYCPLYFIKECGGNFIVLENGIKDCSSCLFPHIKSNYNVMIKKLGAEIEKNKRA